MESKDVFRSRGHGNLYDTSSDFVTPERFYRGSSSGFAWIPA